MLASYMTLDLLSSLDIVEDDVIAVVNAYIADPHRGLLGFGEGYQINPAEAVAAHPFAYKLLQQVWASEELKRAAVRAAIMLAHPEKTSSSGQLIHIRGFLS